MENINPCNIQRSLGEIRCLFCFVYLTLIVLLFLYMVFLRNKNGLWLLKQTPTCQGGKEAFGLIERSSSFFYSKSNKSAILMVMMRRRDPPACRLEGRHSVFSVRRFEVSLGSFLSSVFGQDRGPEVSSCPAVLGDVDPY